MSSGPIVSPSMLMRRAYLLLLTVAAFLVASAPAAADQQFTGRLLVLLDHPPHAKDAQAAAVHAVIARAGGRRSGYSVPHIGLVTVRPAGAQRLSALAARLRADPAVASVQPERRFSLRANPADPALNAQEPAPGAPAGTTLEWRAAREN